MFQKLYTAAPERPVPKRWCTTLNIRAGYPYFQAHALYCLFISALPLALYQAGPFKKSFSQSQLFDLLPPSTASAAPYVGSANAR
jgi:hypothetical protein